MENNRLRLIPIFRAVRSAWSRRSSSTEMAVFMMPLTYTSMRTTDSGGSLVGSDAPLQADQIFGEGMQAGDSWRGQRLFAYPAIVRNAGLNRLRWPKEVRDAAHRNFYLSSRFIEFLSIVTCVWDHSSPCGELLRLLA